MCFLTLSNQNIKGDSGRAKIIWGKDFSGHWNKTEASKKMNITINELIQFSVELHEVLVYTTLSGRLLENLKPDFFSVNLIVYSLIFFLFVTSS